MRQESFFYKYPDQNSGVIPSLVLKEFLSVKGDGISTIDTLLKSKPRALLVATSLRKSLGRRLEEIPALDEEVIVEPIGNHNRGTAFISGNIDIDDELLATFNKISSYLPSFYYGRFDVKSKSLHDLKSGMNTKILEVNGVNAEPAHIYDPNTCLFQGITTLFRHWNIIYEIAKQNRKKGVKTVNLSRAWNHFVNWKKNK